MSISQIYKWIIYTLIDTSAKDPNICVYCLGSKWHSLHCYLGSECSFFRLQSNLFFLSHIITTCQDEAKTKKKPGDDPLFRGFQLMHYTILMECRDMLMPIGYQSEELGNLSLCWYIHL